MKPVLDKVFNNANQIKGDELKGANISGIKAGTPVNFSNPSHAEFFFHHTFASYADFSGLKVQATGKGKSRQDLLFQATFHTSDFTNMNIKHGRIAHNTFEQCDFSGSEFSGNASLEHNIFVNCTFKDVKFNEVFGSNNIIENSRFTNAEGIPGFKSMLYVTVEGSTLHGHTFPNLSHVTFTDCDLSGSTFFGKLYDVKFVRCTLDGVRFAAPRSRHDKDGRGIEFSEVGFDGCKGKYIAFAHVWSKIPSSRMTDCEFSYITVVGNKADKFLPGLAEAMREDKSEREKDAERKRSERANAEVNGDAGGSADETPSEDVGEDTDEGVDEDTCEMSDILRAMGIDLIAALFISKLLRE